MPGLYSDSQEYARYAEDILSRQTRRIVGLRADNETQGSSRRSTGLDKRRRDVIREKPSMDGQEQFKRFGQQIAGILQSRTSAGEASASSELGLARSPLASTTAESTSTDLGHEAALRVQMPANPSGQHQLSPLSSKASRDSSGDFLEEARGKHRQQALGREARADYEDDSGRSSRAIARKIDTDRYNSEAANNRRKKDQLDQHTHPEGETDF